MGVLRGWVRLTGRVPFGVLAGGWIGMGGVTPSGADPLDGDEVACTVVRTGSARSCPSSEELLWRADTPRSSGEVMSLSPASGSRRITSIHTVDARSGLACTRAPRAQQAAAIFSVTASRSR